VTSAGSAAPVRRGAPFPRVGGLSSAWATCSSPPRSRTAATPQVPCEQRASMAVRRLLLDACSGHAGAAAALRVKGRSDRDCPVGDEAEANAAGEGRVRPRILSRLSGKGGVVRAV
jgi:hypothetical protein